MYKSAFSNLLPVWNFLWVFRTAFFFCFKMLKKDSCHNDVYLFYITLRRLSQCYREIGKLIVPMPTTCNNTSKVVGLPNVTSEYHTWTAYRTTITTTKSLHQCSDCFQ